MKWYQSWSWIIFLLLGGFYTYGITSVLAILLLVSRLLISRKLSPNYNELDDTLENNQQFFENQYSSKPIPPKAVYTDKEIYGIGANVEFRRKKLNLTQKQLSEMLGYKSSSFISRLELWELMNLKHEQVEALAMALNTTVDDLLFAKYWF